MCDLRWLFGSVSQFCFVKDGFLTVPEWRHRTTWPEHHHTIWNQTGGLCTDDVTEGQTACELETQTCLCTSGGLCTSDSLCLRSHTTTSLCSLMGPQTQSANAPFICSALLTQTTPDPTESRSSRLPVETSDTCTSRRLPADPSAESAALLFPVSPPFDPESLPPCLDPPRPSSEPTEDLCAPTVSRTELFELSLSRSRRSSRLFSRRPANKHF